MKIIIDAGHGPETAGKRSPDGKLREFHFTSRVAEEAKRLLVLDGHTVIFSHQARLDVPLHERTQLANRLKADLFVSIHANAYGDQFNAANGIETFIYTHPQNATKTLAGFIHSSMLLSTGRKDRGIKQADFAVLRNTRMPAVLVECGFMTNRQEADLLKSDAYQKSCAKAIAFGIHCYESHA